MMMRGTQIVMVALVVGMGLLEARPARGGASPSGTLSFVSAPTLGGSVTFGWSCANLPQQGGATIGCWIEVTCETATAVVVQDVQPAVENVQGPLPVTFGLSAEPASCEAHLFWDGYNNPRRRKTNTLATLYFSVP